MRQIQVIGPVDKRVILYPLFKICNTMGKVLFITDDANFRRFAENYENEFTVSRSDFIITNDITGRIIEDLGGKLSSYDYVIFSTTNNLINENDLTVYCHGNSQLICTDDTLDNLMDVEHSEVVISTKKPVISKDDTEKKNIQYVAVDGKSMSYVWECEENKYFVPCKSPTLVPICAYLFSQILGISSKEEFAKIMAKEE